MDNKNKTKLFEGWRGNIYKDTVGVDTVGWGFNLQDPMVRRLMPKDVLDGKRELTEQEAEPIFTDLYRRAERTAKDFVSDAVYSRLPAKMQGILTDMAYNLGTKLNKFQNMKTAIVGGDMYRTAAEMKNSKWFGQTGNRSQKHYDDVMDMAKGT